MIRYLSMITLLVSAATTCAALTGHYVSNDWSGSGVWENRIAGKTGATIANGTPTLAAAGANASQAGVNFVSFDGASSFNVLGSDAANPFTGLNDFAITVVFTANGNNQINGADNQWWKQAGLIGNELPGGGRTDVGITVDVDTVVGALSDTRDYNYLRDPVPNDVSDTTVHVATLIRQNTNSGTNSADLELWLDGVMVDSFSGSPGGDALLGNPIETSDNSFPHGFAIGANLTNPAVVSDYRSFNGHIAEIQIDGDGSIDVAALHNSLVQNGVYQFVSPASDAISFNIESSGLDLILTWESQNNKLYNLRSRVDPSLNHPSEWPIFDDKTDIAATPPSNTLTITGPLADSTRFFVIEEYDPPPAQAFSDNFESGQGDWAINNTTPGLGPATNWELGTPDNTLADGPAAAASGTNCFGTNLSDNTGNNAAISIVSPVVDLTTAPGATLTFAHFRNIEETFDFGEVRILDADDSDAQLAVLETSIEGLADWETFSKSLPAAALGKNVKFEFYYETDNFNGEPFTGWYIDDVVVTVP